MDAESRVKKLKEFFGSRMLERYRETRRGTFSIGSMRQENTRKAPIVTAH
jgi:hypothetical protein